MARNLDISCFIEVLSAGLPDKRTRTLSTMLLNGAIQEVLIEWREWDGEIITREEVMTRVSDVVAILNFPPTFLRNVLSSPGFFEDSRHNSRGNSWIGIIYHTSSLGYRPRIRTLRELLTASQLDQDIWKPPLGDRFRLAQHLTETLLTVNYCGWLHKGLRPENVVFFPTEKSVNKSYLLGWDYSRSGQRG